MSYRGFAAFIAAVALVSCRPAGERSSEDAGDYGGTLVVAAPGDADVLLPVIAATQLGLQVTGLIFPRLAELPPSLVTVGDSGYRLVLAERVERRDSLTLAFDLDARARWQDGHPVTAADVAFTWDLYRDTLTGSQFAVNLAHIDTVVAEDERTVVFRFRRAYPEQFYDATYHLQIMPRHLLDTVARDSLASSAFARDPVGAGPFRFERWEPGSQLEIVADTGWFRGRPRLDRIVWRVLPDVSTAVTSLIAGDADAMETIFAPDDIQRAEAASDIRLVPYPSPIIGGLTFNTARPPFDNRELRRALAMALDREQIVRSVFGRFGDVPNGALTRTVWASEGEIAQLPFDTAAAARTLDSLGWRLRPGTATRARGGRPLRLTLLVPSTSRVRQQAAVLIQAQWARIGAAVDIRVVEFALFSEREAAGDFEALMFSRTLDPSPSGITQWWTSGGIGHDNAARYASARFDSLMAAATSAPTRQLALERYHAALEQLNLDAPAIFLYSPRNHAAVHRRFQHVVIRPDDWLNTVAEWSVPPDQRLPRDR